MPGARFVVQDVETRQFLGNMGGDVGLTPWLSRAYRFDSAEAAVLTALQECSEGYELATVVDKEG